MLNIKELEGICRVSIEEDVVKSYSRDASIFEVKPALVAFPKNIEELKKLIVHAFQSDGITLTPRAGGTCMSGGSLTEGIMVDMKEGFSSIGEIDIQNNQVWVGAGAYYRDLEVKTLAHNLLFAPYTSSKDICCVGGMVGNNASGEKSIRYGATIDNTLAVKMICTDGNEYIFGEITETELEQKLLQKDFEGELYMGIYNILTKYEDQISSAKPKTKKNAAGLGLWNIWNKEKNTFNIGKLLVGSQGTLGFITEVLIKLVPVRPFSKMIVLPISSLAQLAHAVKTILAFNPEVLETYDNHTYVLAKEHMSINAERVLWKDEYKLVLFALFTGDTDSEALLQAAACSEKLKEEAFFPENIDSKEIEDSHFAIRRASYSLLKNHAPKGFVAVPFIEDTIVPIEKYGEFLEGLEEILVDYKMTYTFAGHIGDGSIRLIPLVQCDSRDSVNQIFDLAERVYKLTISFGGSISVDHNDGIIRTPFLNLMFTDEVLRLFQETKNIFDPKNIFNPGKKVAGTIDFAKKHTFV
ncbi:MAG: FAD-binding oxidoreductase [Patescibacteria group bacterium]